MSDRTLAQCCLRLDLRSRHADSRAPGLTLVRGSSQGRWLPKDLTRQEQPLLTLTEHALTAVRTLTQDPEAPESAGLRITPGTEGLELMLVAEPVPGDALIDELLSRPARHDVLAGMPLTMRLRRHTTRRVRNGCPSSGPQDP